MDRRTFLGSLVGGLLAAPLAAEERAPSIAGIFRFGVHPNRRKGIRWLALWAGFFAASLLLYSKTLSAYFLSDDFDLIGLAITSGFYSGWSGFVRPVIALSYLVDASLWGLDPTGYHVTNVALHALNATLVVVLALRLTGGMTAGLMAGFVFLVLPCHSESVSWISGRTDLIATSFMLLSLILHLRAEEIDARRTRVLALIAFALALLSKESAVVLPAVVVFLTWLKIRQAHRAVAAAVPFLAVLVLYAGLRLLVLGQVIRGADTEAYLGFQVSSLVYHLLSAVIRVVFGQLPDGISNRCCYLSVPRGLLAVVLTFILIPLMRRWPERARTILLLGACFLVSMPLLGLEGVSVGGGDRFLYMPSVFFSIALGWLQLWQQRMARLTSTIVVLGFVAYSAVGLWSANAIWRDAGRLSRALTWEIRRVASGHAEVVVANLPASYRGAAVLRNGISAAVTGFGSGLPMGTISLVSTHGIRSLDEAPVIRRESRLSWTLILAANGSPLGFDSTQTGSVKTGERSSHRVTFEVPPWAEKAAVLYYAAGAMHAADSTVESGRQ
jgi:hypothetical protein